jgi:hypothetical protein
MEIRMMFIKFRIVFIFFMITVGGCAVPVTQPASKATPLQLRVIQTRIFEKPANEVVAAIKEFCEDAGGGGAFNAPLVIDGTTISAFDSYCHIRGGSTKEQTAGEKFFDTLVGSTAQTMKERMDAKFDYQQMKFEIKPKGNKTVVRMRLHRINPVTSTHDQIENAEVYSKWFKRIGDALYVSAIQIDPAVQE